MKKKTPNFQSRLGSWLWWMACGILLLIAVFIPPMYRAFTRQFCINIIKRIGEINSFCNDSPSVYPKET